MDMNKEKNMIKGIKDYWFKVVLFLFLTVFALVLVSLLIFGLSTSLKSNMEFIDNPAGLPLEFKVKNYLDVLQNFSFYISKNVFVNGDKYIVEAKVSLFPELIYNTLMYTVGGAFVTTFCHCIMGYVVAKFDNWKISKFIYSMVIVVMIIPIFGTTASSISVARATGIYDNLLGNWIQKFNFTGIYFLIFHSASKMVAKDYSDAAYVDGASEWKVFFSIVFPLLANTFGTIMLIKFIEFWNDYSTVLIYLPTHPTLAYGIFKMSTTTVTGLSDAPHRIAGAMLLFVPTTIIFVIFNKKLLGNLTVGGVKE